MKYLIICFTLTATLVPQSGPLWLKLDAGRQFAGTNGQLPATVATIDLSRARLRIASVPFEVGKRLGAAELSLRQFADTLAQRTPYRSRDWVVVNGGFSSYTTDVPLGLLIVEGRVYSTISKDKAKSSSSSSEFGQYRWSGILCESTTKGHWDILSVTRYVPGLCKQALQAGPVLVEPDGKVGINPNESKEQPFIRTILCRVSYSQLRIVVTEAPTNLYPLAVWLSKPVSAGGLGCSSAINLSGDSSSGLVVHKRGKGSPQIVGQGTFPLPTALIFEAYEVPKKSFQ